VSVVIGSRLPAEGGPAESSPSPLRSPFGVDFDRDGNMFIVELEGGRVHERRADGTVTRVAGDGSKGAQGDGGPAAEATFNGMHNLAITKTGKAYIADSFNSRIREIDLATRRIRTIAGTDEPGYAGDGGPAGKAQFNEIICVTLSPDEGTLFLADIRNRRIRAIDLNSDARTVRTVAGNGERAVPRDGAAAAESPLFDPRAVAADGEGHVYVLERSGHALRVIDAEGAIRTVAGTGKQGYADGPALEAQFAGPKHLCLDDAGRVYIADDVNAAIRCYDPETQTVTTILGRGHGDPDIKLDRPHGVTWEQGLLYVADSGNDRILRVEFAE
jgi:DNA-binding beta-propeller fold protein YncE